MIEETGTYKRVTQTEKNNWDNKWNQIYAGTSAALSKNNDHKYYSIWCMMYSGGSNRN